MRVWGIIAASLLLVGIVNGQQLVKPSYNYASGFYPASISLSITHPEPGVSIHYTLNGSEPTQSDALYTGPITLDSRVGDPNVYSEIPTNPSFTFPVGDYAASRANNRGWLSPYSEVYKINVVRAKAFKTGFTESEPVTGSFAIEPAGAAIYNYPILSFNIDSTGMFSDETGIFVYGDHPSGNYTQKDTAWERIGHIDFFDDNGSSVYTHDVRVRGHGGGSRHSCKKNLRLYGEYGTENNFHFKFFDDTEQTKFKRLLLRAGGHRPDCLPRDDLANMLTAGTNVGQQHFKTIALFINGEYWGVYSIKERVDEYFFQNQYGVDDNFVTVLDQEHDIQGVGNPADSMEMADLEAFVSTMDMTQQANLDYAAERMDMDNYIDYMSSEIFLSNVDWVYSNVVMWRKTGPYDPTQAPGHDGKFRWLMYDLDGGFGGSCNNAYYTVNTLEAALVDTGLYAPYTRLFRGLMDNTSFRNDFINRSCDLMNSWFKESVFKSRLDSMYNIHTPNMLENVERWRYPSEATTLAARDLEIPSLVQWDTIFNYYMDRFSDRRQRKLREHFMLKWNLPDSSLVTVDVNDINMGRVKVNTLLINEAIPGVNPTPYPWKGLYMDSIPLPMVAVPLPGYKFVEWLGTGVTDDTIYWTPSGDTMLTAVFEADTTFQPILINEVMLNNSAFYADNFQEFDDWLELYNPNQDAINLSGCTIERSGLTWTIPNGTMIDGGGYLIFWHDAQTYQGDNHVNYTLVNSSDVVTLYSPNSSVIDFLSYPSVPTDNSYGRYPNGSGTFSFFTGPTPNMNNDLTGIDELPIENPLLAYPNPASEVVFLNKRVDYTLYDMTGRAMRTGSNERRIDVAGLTPGLYLLTTPRRETVKIVIN